MSKLIICRGIPASGKTFWAEHRVRINQDDIRLMLGKYWVEELVQHIQKEALIEALERGYDIDNTNLNKKVLECTSYRSRKSCL